MVMNPTASNAKGSNTHSYPAYDYPVGIGTGLVAVKDGTITDFPNVPTRQLIGHMQNGNAWPLAGEGSPNSGNVININHGNGEITSYLHTSPFDINALRGKKVKQGDVFHKSGHNGWSTGPHLHFEVWKNGIRVDPGAWLNNINQGGTVDNDTIDANKDIDLLRIIASEIQGWNYNDTHTGKNDEVLKANLTGSFKAAVRNMFANADSTKYRKAKDQAFSKEGEFVETKVYVKKG